MSEPVVDPPVEDEVEETETDQETPPDEAAEWKPPSKEDWEKIQAANTKARKDRDRYRTDLNALRKAVKSADGDGEESKNNHEASEKWRLVAVKKAATVALKEAGFNGDAKAAARLIRTMDLSGVEPDDDGDIDITETIDDLKEELPALFGRAATNGAPRVTTGRGRDDSAPEKDVTKEHSLRLLRMGMSRR